MKISGLVITLNEADNIRDCLESLFQVCDDVVVVDSGSEDGTVKIAEEMGAAVYHQSFLGYGPQKNVGVSLCRHAWILNLDADERLDTDAVLAIRQLDLEGSPYEAYEFRRKNLFHGKWIKCTAWYPDHVKRLFNREKTRFSDLLCHEKVESRVSRKLASHIVHYSYENYHDMLHKMNKYSTQYAEDNASQGKRVSVFSPPLHGLFAFIKNYIFKKGIICGFDGLMISLINALGSYLKYAKLLEKQRYGKGPAV